MILAAFSSCCCYEFWLPFPPAAAKAFAAAAGPRMGKHRGSEGGRSPKIASRKCLTQLLKPIENDDFVCFFSVLLLLWILATFSSCCCRGFCCCWSGWENTMAVKDGEAPNVTSETYRNWRFWLLFPLAAAMNFGYLFLLLLQRLLLLLLVPGWENTVAVKEGEAPKLHPENA